MWVIAAFIIYLIKRKGKPAYSEKGISKEESQSRLWRDIKDMVVSAALGYFSYLAIVALMAGCASLIN